MYFIFEIIANIQAIYITRKFFYSFFTNFLKKAKNRSKVMVLVVFFASIVYLCDHSVAQKRTKVHVRTIHTYTLLNRIYFAFDR